MKTMLIAVLLTATACDDTQSQNTMPFTTAMPEEIPAEELPVEETPIEETPIEEKAQQRSIPSDVEASDKIVVEGEVQSTVAMKLVDPDCVDPDLSKLAAGVSMTLCDGSTGIGTYVAPVIPAPADLTNLVASNIKAGVTINGVTGSYVGAVVPADCNANGQIGCVTTASFKAADLSNLTAGNVKKGVTVAGVAGDFPSSTHPLSGTAAVDLDSYTFMARIKSNSTFEWFDPTGARHEATGSSLIAEENIKAGVSFFNVTGTLAAPTAVIASDLRKGVTVNGTTGKIDMSCDGENKPCSVTNWVNVSQASCVASQSNSCVYQDQSSKTLWVGHDNSKFLTPGTSNRGTYDEAVAHCQSLSVSSLVASISPNGNAVSGWRLPTANEVNDAYKKNIIALPYGMFGNTDDTPVQNATRSFWTSTKQTTSIVLSGQVAVAFDQKVPRPSTTLTYAKVLCVKDM